jgi:hypothetical protein
MQSMHDIRNAKTARDDHKSNCLTPPNHESKVPTTTAKSLPFVGIHNMTDPFRRMANPPPSIAPDRLAMSCLLRAALHLVRITEYKSEPLLHGWANVKKYIGRLLCASACSCF